MYKLENRTTEARYFESRYDSLRHSIPANAKSFLLKTLLAQMQNQNVILCLFCAYFTVKFANYQSDK